MILGFEFYFIRGNDEVVLNSPFCQSASTNLRFVCENDGTLEVHVRLISESSGVESDFCQAYGSLYFSDGEDVAIAMLNWHPIDKYEFPILTDSVSAVEW